MSAQETLTSESIIKSVNELVDSFSQSLVQPSRKVADSPMVRSGSITTKG